MRISRLSLLAYGHFTEAQFDLPPRQPDIHFVYGPNEAGKSTALAGIEDLLFGIPHNTQHAFLHDYGSLRIGAVINGTEGALEFRRRKGNRDTLLDTDDFPLPGGDAALMRFLNGVNRAFYSRMFCLDHQRLQDGGREILEAQDDVGQILFSAGAGIAGLRELLMTLRADADELWARKRASHRKYFQAEERFKEAENALREQTVTAKQWHELRMQFDRADEACRTLEAEIEAKTVEASRLARVRRVYRNVNRYAQIETRLSELRDAVVLPADATRVLDDATKADSAAAARLETLTEHVEAFRQQRSSLTYDETLLARSDEIEQLHELRIRINSERADLPKRQAELASAEANLTACATELDWQLGDVSAIASRVPARGKLAHARDLFARRGELVLGETSARAVCSEANERASALTQEIAEQGPVLDVSTLAAAIRVVREAGDIDTRIAEAEVSAQTAAASIEKIVATMRPVAAEAELAAATVPQKDTVGHYRDRIREIRERLRSCRNEIRDGELKIALRRKEHERVENEEHAIPVEELQALRKRRESGWAMIRRKYVDGVSVSEAEIQAFAASQPLPDAYEASIKAADTAADQRFENAHAVARLAQIAREIAEEGAHLEELRGQEAAFINDEAMLEAEWTALWKDAPITPLAPDDMLVWIELRSQVLQAQEGRTAAEQRLAMLRDDEARQRSRLIAEVSALGVPIEPFQDRSLRVVAERATNVERQNETKAVNLRRLERDLKAAKAELNNKTAAIQKAEDALKDWEGKWSAAIHALGLNPASAPEVLDAHMETLGAMREIANKINDLRHDRIGKIERDISGFERQVEEFVASVSPRLNGRAADDAVIELERLLKVAKDAHQQVIDLECNISAEQKKIDECEETRRTSRQAMERLSKATGVASEEELRHAITRSDEVRSLQTERDKIAQHLADDGDGKPITELTTECQGTDPDQIVASQQNIDQELKTLHERRLQAAQALAGTRRALDEIGGDDRAARAASDRQAALTEMREIAEEYVRVRSAELLLQSTIEHYRREKQAPLLKRAGELFAILTGQSFSKLQVEFGANDKMELVGISQSGQKVSVSGMSDGSADQLYLALRLAAVEDYLSRAESLPFIADDLFIKFDDNRAARGLEILNVLATKTQVLFFTHHKHLTDIADATLHGEASIIYLERPVSAYKTVERDFTSR